MDSSSNQFSVWNLFKRNIPRFLITVFVDIILPLAIYFGFQTFLQSVYALIIAGLPPLIMVIIKLIFYRTFDALGFIVFISFVISAIIGFVTEDPIILLLGQSFITAAICLIFTITLIPFHRCYCRCQIRPLAFYFYQDLTPTTREQLGLPENIFQQEQISYQENQNLISNKQESTELYNWIHRNCSSFRHACFIITIIWSIGLFFEFLGQLILVLFHMPINLMVALGHIIPNSISVSCVIFSIIIISKERKQTITLIELWKREHLNAQ